MEAVEHKLNAVIQSGDKLLPDTAASGRDVIRHQLSGARTQWNRLVEAAAEHNRLRETQAEAAKEHAESVAQLDTWLTSAQGQLEECLENQPDHLEGKKDKLKALKVDNFFQ
jgi:hypothetical protein